MEKQEKPVNEISTKEELEKLGIDELKSKLEKTDRKYKEASFDENFSEMQKYAGEYNILKEIINKKEKEII